MYVTGWDTNFVNNIPSDNGTVSVINTTTNSVSSPIKVGNNPSAIVYDPVNKRMYVTNVRNSTLSVIDTTTSTVVASPLKVENPANIANIAYDPVNNRMYMTNFRNSTVSIINLC
jgi:40-residue YVTN family beta-propeller repeat